MIDEIELVRRFRQETPSPSAAAWTRARMAVGVAAAEADQLWIEASAALDDAGSTNPLADDRDPGGQWFLRHGLRPRVVATAVAATIVLALGLPALAGHTGSDRSSPGHLTTSVTTPWRPARAIPSGAPLSTPGARSGSWVLVGAIVRTGWKLDTSGPPPGAVRCPTVSSCYVTGNSAPSPSGPADVNSLYFSSDGGTSWAVLALPTGFSFTSSLACSDAATCAGGGVIAGQTVFISTVDGGHQWTISPLGFSSDLLDLSCVSASTCSGIAAPSAIVPEIESGGGSDLTPGLVFVHTTNGGESWATDALPVDDLITSMACPTATHCVATGYSLTPQAPSFVLMTDDAGISWSNEALPSGFSFGPLSTLSCGNSTHCMALGYVSNPLVTGIVTTADGGATWQLQALPSDVPDPQLWDVSCSSAQQCWVAGEEEVPRQTATGIDYGSSVVIGTSDGGTTWSKATFVVPPHAPEDIGQDAYMAVGSISCPSPNACVALGASDQGSKNTPVYSNVPSSMP